MLFDYIVYGGGPTGLTLAYFLSKNNYKVALVEKDDILGGCWKVEWDSDVYFTEHSPRVLLGKKTLFFSLLKEIDYKYNVVDTYGNSIETKLKLFNFFRKNLNFSDLLKLGKAKLFKNNSNETVSEWVENNKISEKGKKAIKLFSIVLANSPDKLLMSEIFNTPGNSDNFYQFKNNMGWIDHIENKLIDQNVTIYKGYELKTLNLLVNSITSGIINNGCDETIIGKNHIITFPPIAFQTFLSKQSDKIKNNWMAIDKFNQWVEDSYYISFGFQFHFNEEKKVPNEWCWSCMNDYNLIILPTSDYATTYSKDPNIKTVWSCTIVDTNAFIKNKNKRVNEMTRDEIVNNIKELLDVDPYKITFSDGLQKVNNKWYSKDSAFSVGKSGVINQKGNIENLYTVGPHNFTGITVIGKGVKAAKLFLDNNNIKNFNKSNNLLFIIVLILILIILIWITRKL